MKLWFDKQKQRERAEDSDNFKLVAKEVPKEAQVRVLLLQLVTMRTTSKTPTTLLPIISTWVWCRVTTLLWRIFDGMKSCKEWDQKQS